MLSSFNYFDDIWSSPGDFFGGVVISIDYSESVFIFKTNKGFAKSLLGYHEEFYSKYFQRG